VTYFFIGIVWEQLEGPSAHPLFFVLRCRPLFLSVTLHAPHAEAQRFRFRLSIFDEIQG